MVLYIVLALLSGAICIIAGVLNSTLGENIGVMQSAFINFLGGLLLSIIYALYVKFFVADVAIMYGEIPFYLYLGGAVGFCICVLSNFVYPNIPAVLITLLTFVGQILSGVVIDKYIFGLDISPLKICGVVFFAIGIYYNVVVDKKIIDEEKSDI